MASTDTPEHMPDTDGERADKVEIPEFTDRRGPLIVLAIVVVPPLILALVEILRPAY
jgi:hypothetical protein